MFMNSTVDSTKMIYRSHVKWHSVQVVLPYTVCVCFGRLLVAR